MNRYIKSGVLLCTVCAALLSACAPKDKALISSAEEANDLTYTDSHVAGTLCEGVLVDAELPDLSEVSSYPVISGRMKETDEKVIRQVMDYFFRNHKPEEIREQKSLESEMVNYYIPGSGENWKKSFAIYQAADETGFYFSDDEAYPYPYITDDRALFPTPGTEIAPFVDSGIVDLPFMTREEAVKTVQKQLKQWGIPMIGKPLVYTLDGGNLYELLDNWNQNGYLQTDLSGVSRKMLDCYYMIFDTGYQGIPYTFFQRAVDGRYYDGARLELHFTEQGIIQMEYHWAEYEVEELEQQKSCLSIEEAFACLKRHFEQTVLTSEIDIPKIYFQYVPVSAEEAEGSYVFVPAWVFQPAGEVAGTYNYLDPVLINAITGEEI